MKTMCRVLSLSPAPGSQLMVDSCNVKRVAPRSRARHRARSLTLCCRDSGLARVPARAAARAGASRGRGGPACAPAPRPAQERAHAEARTRASGRDRAARATGTHAAVPRCPTGATRVTGLRMAPSVPVLRRATGSRRAGSAERHTLADGEGVRSDASAPASPGYPTE